MSELSLLGPAVPTAGSLVSGIQQALGTAITSGAFPPGYRLREIPLAQHFGVSSTPVREALRQLENDGLVTFYPRRGAVVVAISSAEVTELYEIRTVLESHAVRTAAQSRPSAAKLAKAREIAEQQKVFADTGEVPTRPIDADFHRELALLGGNAMLAGLIEKATRQIETVQARQQSVILNGMASAAAAHLAIVAKVAAGDADAAEELMRAHLNSACEMVLATLT